MYKYWNDFSLYTWLSCTIFVILFVLAHSCISVSCWCGPWCWWQTLFWSSALSTFGHSGCCCAVSMTLSSIKDWYVVFFPFLFLLSLFFFWGVGEGWWGGGRGWGTGRGLSESEYSHCLPTGIGLFLLCELWSLLSLLWDLSALKQWHWKLWNIWIYESFVEQWKIGYRIAASFLHWTLITFSHTFV